MTPFSGQSTSFSSHPCHCPMGLWTKWQGDRDGGYTWPWQHGLPLTQSHLATAAAECQISHDWALDMAHHSPADQHQLTVPAKPRFFFSSSTILLITADSSSPANQNHKFLTQSSIMTLTLKIKGLSIFLLNFTGQTSTVFTALNIYIFQEPTEQLTKLWTLNGFSSPKSGYRSRSIYGRALKDISVVLTSISFREGHGWLSRQWQY